AEHGMHVHAGPAVVADRDVAQKAQRLALAVDLDRLVGLPGKVEPADGRALEGADRRERGGVEPGGGGEGGDGGKGLLPGVEDEHICAFTGILPDELRFHLRQLGWDENVASRLIIARIRLMHADTAPINSAPKKRFSGGFSGNEKSSPAA